MTKKSLLISNIVVGAPKSGTTWLYRHLSHHPNLCVSSIKETNVFLGARPISASRYWESRGNITDVSPDYFCEPLAVDKIHSYNAEAKILIVLRDPVERALSHYLMLLNYGGSKLGGSELSCDLPWMKPSLYSKWIPMWRSRFGEQVRILEFNQLSHDPERFLNAVYEHFEVERSRELHNIEVGPAFKGRGPARYPYLSWLLSKHYNRQIRGNRVTSILVGRLKKLGFNDLFQRYFTLPIDQEDKHAVKESLIPILARETEFFGVG